MRASREAAHALGFSHLHPYDWPAGVLGDSVLAHGIPIVETEIGGMGTITPEGQALYRQVVLLFFGSL
jgi:predicted deacylase